MAPLRVLPLVVAGLVVSVACSAPVVPAAHPAAPTPRPSNGPRIGLGTNRGLVEGMIRDRVVTAIGQKPLQVSCPTIDPKADFGNGPFECTVVIEGEQLVHYSVTSEKTSDRIHFDQKEAYVPLAQVESLAAGAFVHSMADQRPTVTCPPPRVRVAHAGDEIACDMLAGDVHGWLLVRIKDEGGVVDLRGGRDGTEMGHAPGGGTWVRRALLVQSMIARTVAPSGRPPSKVVCPGRGMLVESAGDEFSCTVTLDGRDVVYDVHLTPATLNVAWRVHGAP